MYCIAWFVGQVYHSKTIIIGMCNIRRDKKDYSNSKFYYLVTVQVHMPKKATNSTVAAILTTTSNQTANFSLTVEGSEQKPMIKKVLQK